MLAILNLLDELDGRKVAVLGVVGELGRYRAAESDLRMVGLRAAQVAHVLLTSGSGLSIIAEAARRAGMKRNTVFD